MRSEDKKFIFGLIIAIFYINIFWIATEDLAISFIVGLIIFGVNLILIGLEIIFKTQRKTKTNIVFVSKQINVLEDILKPKTKKKPKHKGRRNVKKKRNNN